MRWAVPVLMLSLAVARAQLAITEVLPVSRTDPVSGFHGAEFWELTNFATNDVNLHGYGFRDSDPFEFLRTAPFANLVIHAGESIIFFRIENNDQDVLTADHFRAWWGAANLPTNLVCRTYGRPGLSAWDGDAVWLFDASGNVVDAVEFGPIQWGHTFTYDRNTGRFGIPSVLGLDGTVAADLAGDIGSPGATAGPVSMHFLQAPKDQAIDGGMTATFTTVAGGLPRPKYQWYHGAEAIPGAVSASLVASNAGAYHVVIANGLSTATSVEATLTVNTSPTAPSIISGPTDITVFHGQTAFFSVQARGYPPPAYQWQTNGVDVPGAVQPGFEIPGVTEGMICSVTVSNPFGTIDDSAVLVVTRRPNLCFTEVMLAPANAQDNRHFPWVELTNYDTNTVELLGWRFSEEDSFGRAVTITNELTLRPGESVVFAERLDQRLFSRWWGAASLPEMFKIYTYAGFGLDPDGGTFFLWNAAARDPHSEVVSALSWAAATPGLSFECDILITPQGCISEAYVNSVLGARGAFRAEDGGDVGSPGWIENPSLRILSVTHSPLTLLCRVTAGKAYQLYRSTLLDSVWTPLQIQAATNNVMTFGDQPSARQSFYRVRELP